MSTTPKIPVQSITITDADGPIGRVPTKAGIVLDSWSAAESWIHGVARDVTKRRGFCDKVRFRLTYTDGFVYEGRIDVTGHDAKGTPLADHVRMFNRNRSGRGTVCEDTLRAHDVYDPDGRAHSARMLDTYQIGDNAAPAPVAAPATDCAKCGAPFARHVRGKGCTQPDPFEGVAARIRALPEAKRAALLGMLAALEG